MKKKYVYYIVIIFLIGIGLNYLGIFGLGIASMSEQHEREKRRKANQIPQEQWVAEEQYTNFHEPKIDSLLKTNPSQAIIYIDQIIRKYPKKDFLNIYKGTGLYKLDSFELAHQEFKKAMEKAGYEYPTALGNSGWALAKMERYDEAIAEFKKAIKDNTDYIYDLALVYEMKGDFKSAIELYQEEIKRIETKNPLNSKIDPNIVNQIEGLKNKIQEMNNK
ncbi:tetratricopeptide repeat protein [Maribacter confluentis]|uniref:Tetratricopeptide repeat protein n=1 Tax=Maribacter confluentis TaxID=1656093 RepID=A0ABT8RUJ0_9FLAO|nr:tetratricopeptide repeat protein [Maribacter confluentis]MDO1514580.1 tetratricopeptide repeat protein [Maribacter confluentis]